MIRQASWIAGSPINDEQRKTMLEGLNQSDADYGKLRGDHHRQPGAPGVHLRSHRREARAADAPSRSAGQGGSAANVGKARVDEWTSRSRRSAMQSEWLRRKAISSTELTKLLPRADRASSTRSCTR